MNHKPKLLTILIALALLMDGCALAVEPDKEILLWNGAPGSEGETGDEKVRLAERGECVVSNIHKPSITPYLPPAGPEIY